MATVLHARDTSLQSVLPRSVRSSKLFQQTAAPWTSGIHPTAAADPSAAAIIKTTETAVVSPANSYAGVFRAVPNTTNSVHYISAGTINLGAGTHLFEASIYVKLFSGTYDVALQLIDNGSVVSSSNTWFDQNGIIKVAGNTTGAGFASMQRGSFNMGNGWTKLTVLGSYTLQAGATNLSVRVYVGNGSLNATFVGNGTDGFYFYSPFFITGSQPDEVLGDQWLNTTTKSLRIWNGFDWIEAGGSGQAQVGVNLYDSLGNLITTEIRNNQVTINPNGTLGGAGSGQVNLSNLPGTIGTTQINDNSISTPKLQANSVNADKIVAGSIRTDKLLVTGQGSSLVADPAMVDASAWVPAATYSTSSYEFVSGITNIPGGGTTALQNAVGIQTRVLSNVVPVDFAKAYRGDFYLRGVSGSPVVYIGIGWLDASGADMVPGGDNGWVTSGQFSYGLGPHVPTGSWTRFSFSFGLGETAQIPSGAKFMRFAIVLNQSNIAGAQAQVTGARLMEKTAADLIVDGTISANKMVTGLMSADNVLTRNLTVRDGSGNIILAAGSGLPISYAPAGTINTNISIGSNGVLSGAGGGQVTLPGMGLRHFRVGAFGLSASGWPIGAELRDADTNTTLVGGSPMYHVVKINRSTGVITSVGGYNTLAGGANPGNMAAALNAIGNDHIVVIYSYDEPQGNRLLSGLDAAMYRCGASRAIFGSPTFRFRSAYILIGIPGCGEGNGFEAYAGAVDNDANAWCDVAFSVRNGNFIVSGASKTPNTLADYSYTGDLNASAATTIIAHSGVSVSGSTIVKTAGGGLWDAAAYSKEGFTGGAYVSFVPAVNGISCGVGLNTDPLNSTGYGDIDYWYYLDPSGDAYAFDSGVSTGIGSWAAGDVLSVEYDGSRIRFRRNGTVQHTITATITAPLYMDSSFNSTGSKVTNVQFGPYGSPSAVQPSNPITSGNVSTFIANAAIQNAQIGNLDAGKINAGTISADRIGAGSIDASKLSVSQLSAISANVGLLRTATTGARTEIESNQIRIYDASNVLRVRMGVW